ncbi:hypothetical protein D3C76_952130 [compost metagenome]
MFVSIPPSTHSTYFLSKVVLISSFTTLETFGVISDGFKTAVLPADNAPIKGSISSWNG